MKRGQVFVRATDETGRWGTVDVLDLDEDSFRAFVVETFVRAEVVTSIREEMVEGERIRYRAKAGVKVE